MVFLADETTENAIKEDSYEPTPKSHHASKHRSHRPSLEGDAVETDQLEKISPADVKDDDHSEENTKVSQSESRESDETESETESKESETQPDSSEDSSEGHQAEEAPSDDKSEKHEELKDGFEGL